MTLVACSSISKSYGSFKLFDGVTFKLNKGEITTLIGHNGVGKTTLARIILGLEKYEQGKIEIAKRITIEYVPQKLDIRYSLPITVDSLLEILSKKKFSNNGGSFYNNLATFVDYDKIREKDISDISGGQLQKVLLVGAMLSKPDLLILDEPTQYLDVSSQQEFYSILNILKNSFKTTIFMISHDLFTVMKNSDQVICMNGHVCCSGKPTDLENNLELKNALSEIGLYIHQHDHKH